MNKKKKKAKQIPQMQNNDNSKVLIGNKYFSAIYKPLLKKDLYFFCEDAVCPMEFKMLDRNNYIDVKYLMGTF